MRKLSIGLRLTLWYLAIFLLAEVIFGLGMWLILRQNLFDIADTALEGQAADLQRFLEARKDLSAAQLQAEISEDRRIERSEDYLQITESTDYLVNSEGTSLRFPEDLSFVRIRAYGLAADGASVRDAEVIQSFEITGLPPEAELRRQATEVANNVTALTRVTG